MNDVIMIVDDMNLNIELLSGSLDDKYVVVPATSGEAAIKLLDRKKPDLVLLDVSMPGIDGFGVLEFMKGRKDLSNIPVIFVTGEHESYSEEKGLELGAVDYITKPFNAVSIGKKIENHLELKSYRDNLELLVQERTKQLAASREAIIMGMSLMSDMHDGVTGEHITRIKKCTELLTRKIRKLYPELLTEEYAKRIVLFSPLHDVGKISISDTILKKKGILTPEEFEIMKSHTLEGAEVLRQTDFFLEENGVSGELETAIEIAECHHERYDGTGYPHGMKGDEIPLSARIVSISDVYDALRSPRPYKGALTHEESMNIISCGDGRTSRNHFDPKVLEAFTAIQDSIKSIY